MEMLTRLMITGGEAAEEERMTRASVMIREAILIAAQKRLTKTARCCGRFNVLARTL
jgi:hypothetical protein